MSSTKPLSFLAIDFEPYFQSRVLTELGNRGHSIISATSVDYDPCQLISCNAALIYLPPFEQRNKIEDFLGKQKDFRINMVGLTHSFADNKLYQSQFPRSHFESLMDVVVPRNCSKIADIIEKKLSA